MRSSKQSSQLWKSAYLTRGESSLIVSHIGYMDTVEERTTSVPSVLMVSDTLAFLERNSWCFRYSLPCTTSCMWSSGGCSQLNRFCKFSQILLSEQANEANKQSTINKICSTLLYLPASSSIVQLETQTWTPQLIHFNHSGMWKVWILQEDSGMKNSSSTSKGDVVIKIHKNFLSSCLYTETVQFDGRCSPTN